MIALPGKLVIETVGLKKTYQGKLPTPVLFGIDLRVVAGEFVSIIGQSGSGKSTLLNILGALDVPSEGLVKIDGVDISTLTDDGLAVLRSEVVGFVFQAHFLLEELTCLENAVLPIIIRKGSATQEEVEWIHGLLVRVGLGGQLHKSPDTMSGGENQRCAIVRALANRPRIVLADEPTGNLDSHSGEEVFQLMRQMSAEIGIAFVMVTHDERLAHAADRILMIEDGLMRSIE
ncbi:MAG: ABC transporter ATP-binding protein [Acidobacteria bacterium]|nr:ABC transporter ATP-binding protein [Acidobacteriota bacterium]